MTIKGDYYLVAKYIRSPKMKGMTAMKNFGSKEDLWQWNEHVEFKNKVSNADYKNAAVILAIQEGKIIRNSMNPDKSFNELYSYYYSNGFSKQLDQIREAYQRAEETVKQLIHEAMEKQRKENEPWPWPTSMPEEVIDNIQGPTGEKDNA